MKISGIFLSIINTQFNYNSETWTFARVSSFKDVKYQLTTLLGNSTAIMPEMIPSNS